MLRKKAPYTCRHAVNGKLDHAAQPLLESEGELCKAHQEAEDRAGEKFFNTPVWTPPAPVAVTVRRIWP